jgi:hypothetical protein
LDALDTVVLRLKARCLCACKLFKGMAHYGVYGTGYLFVVKKKDFARSPGGLI